MGYQPRGFRISTQSRHSLSILADLARHADETPRSAKSIATALGISVKYVSRLVLPLLKARYIASVFGPTGGYALTREPQAITALEIIDLVDGAFHINPCLEDNKDCARHDHCSMLTLWRRIDDQMRGVFANVTVQDIADHLEYGCR